ncbi:GNAT family N-acetyltransferase [Chromobacterium phragmitis]|uniref:GNAT family N-acetyltransferase n=1 Tax=Chromobacterium amazonense TaxID=1382803 RepID=UPI0021B70A11|nr:GNAT family N-acetyltransferase [Chromobacterium amazonense]MBM2884251.1 GNAT family N-acetyltransferase [Chromobacterium amazonense]MDE1711454.1 GNAT family N-acetyltransferase [Chromobacterium amazonense]
MNTILLDIPDQIESRRLILRSPLPGDGAAVHAGVVATLEQLRAWPASMPWAQEAPSAEASETFCRQGRVDYLARKNLPLLLFLKDGGHFIGASGLHGIHWKHKQAEIGYWCHRAWQGQGLISEAVKAVADFAMTQLQFRRLTCLPDTLNLDSRRVAERAGFQLEDILRNERIAPDGSMRDTALYALTN